MAHPLRTVILGGYGNFGARIARRLSQDAGIQLVIAGRSVEQAQAFSSALPVKAESVAIDINQPDLAARLQSCGAELVIHAAGPFQQQDYHVPQAAAEAGCHYVDLADGRRFVCDFSSQLDYCFTKQKKLAITGASTVPALSSAVVNHLADAFASIESIDVCIAPAQSAPRGVATMGAVLGYCGEKIRIYQDGVWRDAYGWESPTRVEFARMVARRGALCDIPDLELFPACYPGVKTVMFRAALEVWIAQSCFAMLSRLRRWKLLPPMQRWAGVMHSAATMLDGLGTQLGGMVVTVRGLALDNQVKTLSWHIAADNNHGPEIPCMAAVLLAQKLAYGQLDGVGAMPCVGLLKLEEFEPEFRIWGMQTDLVGN